MQETKAKASSLPAAELTNDAVYPEVQPGYNVVSTDVAGTDEVSVEATAPSPPTDCQPLLTESQPEMKSGDSGSVIPATDAETSSPSSAVGKSDHANADVIADDRCQAAGVKYEDVCAGDVIDAHIAMKVESVDVDVAAVPCDVEVFLPTNVSSSDEGRQTVLVAETSCIDADTAVKTTSLDVGAAAVPIDVEIVSSSEEGHQTTDVAATHGTTSQLDLGSILAESFVGTTHSAASVVSTQATIGSALAACEALSSSDPRTSSAGRQLCHCAVAAGFSSVLAC